MFLSEFRSVKKWKYFMVREDDTNRLYQRAPLKNKPDSCIRMDLSSGELRRSRPLFRKTFNATDEVALLFEEE